MVVLTAPSQPVFNKTKIHAVNIDMKAAEPETFMDWKDNRSTKLAFIVRRLLISKTWRGRNGGVFSGKDLECLQRLRFPCYILVKST
jgi:hypothetical protein